MINDISNYFIGSVQGDEGELYIVNKDDDRGTRGIRSSYTKETGSTSSLRGLRLRHSVSFTPLGKQAEMYVTAYGLTEEELPVETCPTGLLAVRLPGMCYGGQDCSQETDGHLIFLRSTKEGDEISTDQLNHEHYRNKVFLPFVEKNRKHYIKEDEWQPGDPVDDDYVWAGWQVC